MKVEKLKGVWQCQCDERTLLVTARADGGSQWLIYGGFTEVQVSLVLDAKETAAITVLTDDGVSCGEAVDGELIAFTPTSRGEPYRKGFDIDVVFKGAQFETQLMFLSAPDCKSLVAFLGRLRHVGKEG